MFSFFAFSVAYSQTVKTKTETARINGETMDGYETALEGNSVDVSAALVKYLKSLSIGKVKQSAGTITITDPIVNGTHVLLSHLRHHQRQQQHFLSLARHKNLRLERR